MVSARYLDLTADQILVLDHIKHQLGNLSPFRTFYSHLFGDQHSVFALDNRRLFYCVSLYIANAFSAVFF